ncbi:hypothetical protein VTO42DRAFT_4922 [Malbranchea cinnamomea]
MHSYDASYLFRCLRHGNVKNTSGIGLRGAPVASGCPFVVIVGVRRQRKVDCKARTYYLADHDGKLLSSRKILIAVSTTLTRERR